MQDEFEFRLSKPVEYHHKGEVKTAEVLILKAPSLRHNRQRVKLQQGFFQAMQGIKQNDSKTQAEDAAASEIKGGDVLAMMLSSSVDMVEFYDVFLDLAAQKGICLIEGEENATKDFFNKLPVDDVDKILGDYMANFILASALETLTSK